MLASLLQSYDTPHYSLNTAYATVERVMSGLFFDRCHLVGYSFGGIVAQKYAAQYESRPRLQSVILMHSIFETNLFPKAKKHVIKKQNKQNSDVVDYMELPDGVKIRRSGFTYDDSTGFETTFDVGNIVSPCLVIAGNSDTDVVGYTKSPVGAPGEFLAKISSEQKKLVVYPTNHAGCTKSTNLPKKTALVVASGVDKPFLRNRACVFPNIAADIHLFISTSFTFEDEELYQNYDMSTSMSREVCGSA